jgi:hypothetical protein
MVVSDLTPNEMRRIFWFLHPEVRCAIAARAVFAQSFLLPGMKRASLIMSGFFIFYLSSFLSLFYFPPILFSFVPCVSLHPDYVCSFLLLCRSETFH